MVDDARFLRAHTDRVAKVTVPGPFTMSQQAQNDHYADAAELALAYAGVVNAEIRDLFAAGADIVQVDEPYLQARPDAAREYGLAALNRALAGITGTTAVHLCFGYAAIIHERPSGYSFLPELGRAARATRSRSRPRSPGSTSACSPTSRRRRSSSACSTWTTTPSSRPARWRAACGARSTYLPPEQIVLAPDCGMKYLPRASAYGKLESMVAAAELLRRELGAA